MKIFRNILYVTFIFWLIGLTYMVLAPFSINNIELSHALSLSLSELLSIIIIPVSAFLVVGYIIYLVISKSKPSTIIGNIGQKFLDSSVSNQEDAFLFKQYIDKIRIAAILAFVSLFLYLFFESMRDSTGWFGIIIIAMFFMALIGLSIIFVLLSILLKITVWALNNNSESARRFVRFAIRIPVLLIWAILLAVGIFISKI